MWLLVVPGLIVGAILAVTIFGLTQPVKHTVTRSIVLKQKPDVVFAAIDDAEAYPTWSSMITKVERMGEREGRPATKQTLKIGMTVIVTTLEREPATRLVTRMEKEGGPVWGTWTYELRPEGEGCRVTITEEGEMKNPLFRGLAGLRGVDASIKCQLGDLGRKFGGETIMLNDNVER